MRQLLFVFLSVCLLQCTFPPRVTVTDGHSGRQSQDTSTRRQQVAINADGTSNWGNQNNPTHGNCLDVLSKRSMSLSEAGRVSNRVDVIFVAAHNSFQFWSPHYAKIETAALYTSRPTQQSVSGWRYINESEIAETTLSGSQFDNIQTDAQIVSAVKSAHNPLPSLTLFGKLDGKVLAVRNEMEGRTAYALIKIEQHFGTEGSSGYLRVRIKSQGR